MRAWFIWTSQACISEQAEWNAFFSSQGKPQQVVHCLGDPPMRKHIFSMGRPTMTVVSGFWAPLGSCTVCKKCRILINTSLAARCNLQLCACSFEMCIHICKRGIWRGVVVPNLAWWGWWFPLVSENIWNISLGQDGQDLSLLASSVDSSKEQSLHTAADALVVCWEMDGGNLVAGWAFSLHQLVDCQHRVWAVAWLSGQWYNPAPWGVPWVFLQLIF